jgi:hypothetical protein
MDELKSQGGFMDRACTIRDIVASDCKSVSYVLVTTQSLQSIC